MRLTLTIAIVITLLLRLYLAVTRYIDPDEFAHLHWAYLLASGKIPYKDFFINFTPLYHVLFIPLFWLPQGPDIVLLARLIQFLLSLISLVLLYTLSIQITNNRLVGLMAIIISLSFPMIFDKSIELRPDLLMTVWMLAAFVAIGRKKPWSPGRALGIGLSIGLGLVTLVKILYAVPALVVYVAYQVPKNLRGKLFFWMGIGIMVPIGLYVLYLLYNGAAWLAYENIISGSLLLKRGEGAFSPWLSFSPLPLVYMHAGGPSIPWLANTAIWIAAGAGLFVLARKNRPAAGVFFLFLGPGLIALFLFPTPYLQYFIPLSVFVSILAAIWIRAMGKPLLQGLFLLLLILSFSQQYQGRVRDTNEEQRAVIADVLAISNPGEPFYDMVGSYVFRPDGYYICCNIYSQFADQLNLKLPTLARSLAASQTKFLVLDRAGKSLWLPAPDDLLFLQTNYLPSAYPKIYTLGIAFRCTNGACTQYRLDGEPGANRSANTFTILVPETYTVTVEPVSETFLIDDQPIQNGQTLPLAAGVHPFAAPPTISSFRLQLAR